MIVYFSPLLCYRHILHSRNLSFEELDNRLQTFEFFCLFLELYVLQICFNLSISD
jgi:hypothetical protein